MVRRDDVQWCDLKQTELCCRKEATTTPAPAEDEKKNKEHNLPCLHWDIDDGTVDGVRLSIKISLDDGRDEERASYYCYLFGCGDVAALINRECSCSATTCFFPRTSNISFDILLPSTCWSLMWHLSLTLFAWQSSRCHSSVWTASREVDAPCWTGHRTIIVLQGVACIN